MGKLPFWAGVGLRQMAKLLAVVALGASALPVTMWMASASTNKGAEPQLLPAYSQPSSPNQTETATLTVTATLTTEATSTATAMATRTATQVPALTSTATATRGTPETTRTPSLVTICHRTGSGNNPYVQITVDESAVPAHSRHGDIIPAPVGGCPAVQTVTPGARSKAAPPVTTGTVTNQKVAICHRTGSSNNPYVMITVSTNALPEHTAHGDIVPAPADGCPAVAPGGTAVAPTGAKKPGNGNGKGVGNVNRGENGNGTTEAPGQQKDKEKDKQKEKNEDKDSGGTDKDNGSKGNKGKP